MYGPGFSGRSRFSLPPAEAGFLDESPGFTGCGGPPANNSATGNEEESAAGVAAFTLDASPTSFCLGGTVTSAGVRGEGSVSRRCIGRWVGSPSGQM